MKINISLLESKGFHVQDYYDDNIIVIKEFLSQKICEEVVVKIHNLMKKLPYRSEIDGIFYSIDVLPSNTKTNRIFRTIDFREESSIKKFDDVSLIFKKMKDFQSSYVINEADIKLNQRHRLQFIHYPKGGGWFDWHQHPRYPVNYGLILNLTERGKNFDIGSTEIELENGDVISVEDIANIGDLILFRYDLRHRVSPCNPYDDLVFDANGRWTAILPID